MSCPRPKSPLGRLRNHWHSSQPKIKKTIQVPLHSSSSVTNADRKEFTFRSARSLWDEVCDHTFASAQTGELREAVKQVRKDIENQKTAFLIVPLAVSPELNICNEVLQAAQRKQSECTDKQWRVLGHGDVNLWSLYGSIASYAQKFVAVGDVAAQIDPLHFGLPWAGVRLVLLLVTGSSSHDTLVIEGLAYVASLIFRYGVFEEIYLRGECPVQGDLYTGLCKELKKIYQSILLFLLKTQAFYSRDSASRFIQGATSLENSSRLLENIRQMDAEVQRYESLALRQTATRQFLSIREALSAYTDRLQKQEREDILSWISTIDYRSYYLDIYNRLMPGTGEWLFKKPEFVQWKNDHDSSLLWLRGDAGTGKSSLVARSISRLELEPQLDSNEGFAYFHCSRISGHHEREDPEMILRSLLQQLASPIRGLPIKTPILNRYEQEKDLGNRAIGLSQTQVQDLVLQLIDMHYTRVTVIIDALDEIDTRKRANFFAFLSKLTVPRKTVVKILLASRNEPDILEYFGRSGNIYIDATDNAEDIQRYITQEIDNRLLMGKANEGLKTQVREMLMSKVHGMFRWVEMQISSLCDPEYVYCVNDVEEALGQLPETLEATYAETIKKFARYGSTSRTAMEKTLRLLMCAEDTMSIVTLMGAICVNDSGQYIDLDKMAIVRMSQSLIVIDEESQIFRFAHLSVREYLEKNPSFSGELAHAVTAEACLINLMESPASSKQPLFADEMMEASKQRSLLAFSPYSSDYWAQHCMKANLQRQRGRLRVRLFQFLDPKGNTAYFKDWNRHAQRRLLYAMYQRLATRIRDSTSYPVQPLFVVCTYGFHELVPSLFNGDSNLLKIENQAGRNCVEVAALRNQLDTIKALFSLCSTSQFSEKWFKGVMRIAAAGSQNVENFKHLISMKGDLPVDDDLIRHAASNTKCGGGILDTILAQSPSFEISEKILQEVASWCQSTEGLRLLLAKFKKPDITEETFVAAGENRHCLAQVLHLLIAHCRDFRLTQEIVLSVLSCGPFKADCGKAIDALFSEGRDCPISPKLLEAAAACDSDSRYIMRLFLARSETPKITECILKHVVSNWGCGLETLPMITDGFDLPPITEWILENAVINGANGVEILEHLFALPNRFEYPEELFVLAAGYDISIQEGMIPFLLNRYQSIEITEELLLITSGAEEDTMRLLLSRPRAVPINESMIETAASNSIGMMNLLLEHVPNMTITENILIAAAANYRDSFQVLKVLLARPGTAKKINQRTIISALNSSPVDIRVIILLFEKASHISVTNAILLAGSNADLETMNFLLDHGTMKSSISVDVLLRSMSDRKGSGLFKLLLPRIENGHITEAVLEKAASIGNLEEIEMLLALVRPVSYSGLVTAASGNRFDGEKLVSFFLSKENSAVTKDAFIAAAGVQPWSSDTNTEIIELLCQSSDFSTWSRFVQDAAITAATNQDNGFAIIKFLTTTSGFLAVTKELLHAATKNTEVLEFLLSLSKDSSLITNELLMVAARNGFQGIKSLSILLGHKIDINLTEEILEICVRTEPPENYEKYQSSVRWHARSMMEPLLQHRSTRITENVIKAGASNEAWGLQMTRLLLTHRKPFVPMTQHIFETAAANRQSGHKIIRFILEEYATEVNVTRELVEVAAQNSGCGQKILQQLFPRAAQLEGRDILNGIITAMRNDTNGLRDALFHTAFQGQAAAFKILMDAGADISETLDDIGNVLSIAAFNGKLDIVELLLSDAARLDGSGPYGSALTAACSQGHIDIAKCLAKAGVDLETPNYMKRTSLHRLLRSQSSYLATILLDLGASVTARDLQNLTALHHAVIEGSAPAVKALLEHNASVDAKDSLSWVPLHWAARKGDLTIVEILTNAGSNKEAMDEQGKTPLEIAMYFGNDKLRAALYTQGKELPVLKRGVFKHGIHCAACGLDVCGDHHSCQDCLDYDLCYRCIIDSELIHKPEHKLV